MSIFVTKTFCFQAAHSLPEHEGKCKNLHGHNYKLEVTITAPNYRTPRKDKTPPSDSYMIMDFGHLKNIVEEAVIRDVDHKNLNDIFAHTTAEYLIEAFAIRIVRQLSFWEPAFRNRHVKLYKLVLYETNDSYVTWINDGKTHGV